MIPALPMTLSMILSILVRPASEHTVILLTEAVEAFGERWDALAELRESAVRMASSLEALGMSADSLDGMVDQIRRRERCALHWWCKAEERLRQVREALAEEAESLRAWEY